METEVIYLSSDDESASQKENKKNQSIAVATTIYKTSNVCEKLEIPSSDDEKEGNKMKRKISQIDKEEATCNNVEKKRKLSTDRDICEVINEKLVFDSNLVSDNIIQPDNKEATVKKPKLIVKEKKKISYIEHNIFPLFISLCLQKSQNNKDKEDMEKIVTKLKRRYENMDPIYANSKNFTSFLNEKREAIKNNSCKKYVYIEEVMNHMKSRKKTTPQNNERYDAIPSTSYATNNLVNNTTEHMPSDEDDNDDSEQLRLRKKIKQVQHAMVKCEIMIKKLEEAEVDFQDENDSTYIKVERYKQRMVELFNKLCELTGENADAGRAYLRPKHFSTTRIVVVDQAITNFINSKITQRNQMRKVGALTNDLIFPDYRDILECVNRCNEKKNLGLDGRKRQQMAKKAFVELGEYLQRARRNDYWDTFSLFLENTEEDPAIKDKDLAKKLTENHAIGDKRLTAVFEQYTKRQEELKEQNRTLSEEDEEEEQDEEEEEEEEEEDEEEEEKEEEREEESIINDEDKSKDDLFICNMSDENDNEEDVDKTVKENESGIEKRKNGMSITNDRNTDRSSDEGTNRISSNVNTSNVSQTKCNKNITIETPTRESETIMSENGNKTVNERTVCEPCADDVVTITRDVRRDTEKQNNDIVSILSSSPADCASNVNRVEEDLDKLITEEITDPITETAKKQTADIINDQTESKKEKTQNNAEAITENKIINITKTEMKVGDVMEVIEADVMDTMCEYMPGDKQLEEEEEEEGEVKKPWLRVCSFAKPPMTWEDNRQKGNKSASQPTAQPKVINRAKDVIDLTNETTMTTTTTTTTISTATTTATTKSQSILTKYGIKIGDRLIPVVKRQTVLIPPGRNIINFQNITNNYLKVNKRMGQVVTPNPCNSMIIRLPTVQSVANQSQNANTVAARNEVPLKKKETVVQIIQPKKPLILSKKSATQPVCKQVGTGPATTKPK